MTRKRMGNQIKTITFSVEMARATMDDMKNNFFIPANVVDVDPYPVLDNVEEIIKKHSKFKVGDIVVVREPAKVIESFLNEKDEYRHYINYSYSSDGSKHTMKTPERFRLLKGGRIHTSKWIEQSQFSPGGCIKEMCRIKLKIKYIYMKKIQDLNEKEMLNYGIRKVSKDNEVFKYCIYDEKDYSSTPWSVMDKTILPVFKDHWNSSNKKIFSYENNIYLFIYEFKCI